MSRAALLLFIARAVSALATVAVLAVVARLGSPEDLGIVALGLSIGLALAVIPEAGLTALLIREVARWPERAGSILGAILFSRAIALPLVSVALLALLAITYPAYAPTLLIIALGPAFQQIGELARGVFLARGRPGYSSAHSIVENVAWLIAITWSLARGLDLTESFIVALAVLVVVEVVAYVLLAIVVGVRVARPSMDEMRDLFGQAGPFVAFGTLMVIASRSDTILVALLLPNGLVVAGAYFAVSRLVAAGEYLPEAVSRAILPEISRRFAQAPTSIREALAPAARQLLAISIAIPFGFRARWGMAFGPHLRLRIRRLRVAARRACRRPAVPLREHAVWHGAYRRRWSGSTDGRARLVGRRIDHPPARPDTRDRDRWRHHRRLRRLDDHGGVGDAGCHPATRVDRSGSGTSCGRWPQPASASASAG